MTNHIKTAQAIAELPDEAGCKKWPWVICKPEQGKMRVEEKIQWIPTPACFILSPWLRIDDFSPWSSAKWLERAVGDDKNEGTIDLSFCLEKKIWSLVVIIPDGGQIQVSGESLELVFMKAIPAIGQRAFGLGEFAEKICPVCLDEDVLEDLCETCGCTGKVGMTVEQRKPWLEAWNRGQDAT